jgi:Ca-activated chloride channel family protein
VREADVSFYPIHLSDWSSESLDTEYTLRQFATESGGHYSRARKASDFPLIAESLEVRQYYVLGYSPRQPKWDGKFRRIALKAPAARGKRIRLSWRRGYFTPPP